MARAEALNLALLDRTGGPFVRFRGFSREQWSSWWEQTRSSDGEPPLDQLRAMLLWWEAHGLAVFSRRNVALESVEFVCDLIWGCNPSLAGSLHLPWVVSEDAFAAASARPWWPAIGLYRDWGPRLQVAREVASTPDGWNGTLRQAVESLVGIAVAQQGSLVLVDHHPNREPFEMLCRAIRDVARPAPPPTIRVYSDRAELAKCQLLSASRSLQETGVRTLCMHIAKSRIHDRYLAVQAPGGRGQPGARLVTAMLLGNGIDMFREICATSTCARIHGQALDDLESVLRTVPGEGQDLRSFVAAPRPRSDAIPQRSDGRNGAPLRGGQKSL